MRTYFPLAIFTLASAGMIAAPVGNNPVLGVVSSRTSFALSRVETRPEAGPLPVVDGDEVSAGVAPVLFRLTGPNRVVLGGNSHAQIRPIHDAGRYFYLSKGSIQFDAMKEPLAICAAGRLYLPTVPSSGEVVILEGKRADNNKVDVHMTSGVMERNGQDTCTSKVVPAFLLQGAMGATAGVAGAAGAAGAASAVGAAGAGAAGAAGAGAAAGAAAGVAGAGVAGATVAGVAGITTATAVGAGVAAGVATVATVTGTAATPPSPPQASNSIPTP